MTDCYGYNTFWTVQVLFSFSVTLIKISILFFYYRIFSSRKVKDYPYRDRDFPDCVVPRSIHLSDAFMQTNRFLLGQIDSQRTMHQREYRWLRDYRR